MAVKIFEPEPDHVSIDDWHKILNRTTKQGGGFICIELTNIDSTEKPEIVAGSRLEVNGAFYEIVSNETIPGTPTTPAWNNNNYIYTEFKNDGSLGFIFSNSPPAWNAALGGWYSGNCRAIAKFFYVDGQYNGKVILDSFNAMQNVNTKQIVPNSGGVLVFSQEPGNAPINTTVNAIPGMYRFQVRGGSSGNGGTAGAGGSGGGANGNPGTGGNLGESRDGTFIHLGGDIHIKVGADGGDGGNGGNGANGYHVGGGMGEGGADVPGANGGAGGGGGSGMESAINGVVARGGLPGQGGLGNPYSTSGQNGSYGMGGDGSKGDDNGNAGHLGTAGTRGSGLKSTSNGYARIWRVG